jgi:hypothetical protein
MSLKAVTDTWGTKWYDANGKVHRDGDLPAAVCADGSQYWCHHGELHRDGDLPALVSGNGNKWWFRRGERHRDNDLPAVVSANGSWQEWWVDGVRQTPEDRAQTRRWSSLRAAFVGAVVHNRVIAYTHASHICLFDCTTTRGTT